MPERRPADHGGLNLGEIPSFEGDEERQANPYAGLDADAIGDLEKRLAADTIQWKEELDPPKKKLMDMPADPTSLGTVLFGYFDNALEHWRFVASVAASLESSALVLKQQLDWIHATLKKQGRDTAEIETDEEYVKCNARLTKVKAELIQLEPTKSFLSRRMQQLSRLVEGVKMDIELGGRQGRLGTPRRGSSGGLRTPV